MYSKEDFLAISEEYAKEKKEVENKYKKRITKCCIMMGLFGVLIIVFLCVMLFKPMLGLLSILFIILMIVAAIMWQTNINKRKAELEELANTHYRNYVNKNSNN